MSRNDAGPVWIANRAQYEAPGSPRLIFHEWGSAGLSVCGLDLARGDMKTIRVDWATALNARLCRNCEAILEARP